MSTTRDRLPEGVASKRELILRCLSMGWAETMSPRQIREKIRQQHNVDIGNTDLYRMRADYYKSLGKKVPKRWRGLNQVNLPVERQSTNGSSEPYTALNALLQAIQSCGGIPHTRQLLDLLERGIS